MSTTGLQVFDQTLQLTNIWLKSLMEKQGWTDRHRAYLALRATLHALRDRMNPDEAAHLGAQLPMLVRGVFSLLADRVTAGEIADVKQTLPKGVRDLWPV